MFIKKKKKKKKRVRFLPRHKNTFIRITHIHLTKGYRTSILFIYSYNNAY